MRRMTIGGGFGTIFYVSNLIIAVAMPAAVDGQVPDSDMQIGEIFP